MEELINNGAFYFKVKSWAYLIGLGFMVICILWFVIEGLIMLFKEWNYKRKEKANANGKGSANANGKRKASNFIKKYYDRKR